MDAAEYPPINEAVECIAFEPPWPGSAGRCPRCHGTKVMGADWKADGFYARRIAICGPCGIAWEPIDEALIWDRSDAICSFSEPCDNCAFRPGSPEQKDKAGWKDTIAKLREGGSFYCHKGVPLAPGNGVGFAYPQKKVTIEFEGAKVEADLHDTSALRLCRGYLNALGAWWRKGAAS